MKNKYDMLLVTISKLQVNHLKIFEAKLHSTNKTVTRDLKVRGEENTKLWTCIDKIFLDIQYVIKDVWPFNKHYTKKISKTNESYSKGFQDIKSSLALLEKKIQIVNRDQVTTAFNTIYRNFEKLMTPILNVVRRLPTSDPQFSPNIMSQGGEKVGRSGSGYGSGLGIHEKQI